jgi:hypothetical protein
MPAALSSFILTTTLILQKGKLRLRKAGWLAHHCTATEGECWSWPGQIGEPSFSPCSLSSQTALPNE